MARTLGEWADLFGYRLAFGFRKDGDRYVAEEYDGYREVLLEDRSRYKTVRFLMSSPFGERASVSFYLGDDADEVLWRCMGALQCFRSLREDAGASSAESVETAATARL